MSAPINEDFRDLLQAFADHEVRFMIVGAYALAVHGQPRATGDLDVWIDPAPANAGRAYRALASFGAPLNELAEQDLATPGVVFQIGVVPRRIDVLTQITGVAFADAWPRRVESSYEGVRFAVIGREDLIANKRALGRPQDLLDAERVERSGKAT